jgi:hypothetical protein
MSARRRMAKLLPPLAWDVLNGSLGQAVPGLLASY